MLNFQHQNLKLTIEKATKSLSFQGVEIKFVKVEWKGVARKPFHIEFLLNLLLFVLKRKEIRINYVSVTLS